MKEKFIRLIIYYVLSVYDEDKKTKESCIEIAKLILSMLNNDENKADRLINSFPSNHPVTLIYEEIKDNNSKKLIDSLEGAINSLNNYKLENNTLKELEDDTDVNELSKKISKV